MPHLGVASPEADCAGDPGPRARVFFRVDADESIGSGHLVRCRVLADALRRRRIASTFLTSSTPEMLCRPLCAEGHGRVGLPPERAADPGCLLQAVGINGASMLVVDHDAPAFYETAWQRKIRAAGVRLMIITFRDDCRFAADLVLNPNLLAMSRPYSAESCTRLLLGPRYALLGQSFRELHDAAPRVTLLPRNVLVTFGGADRQGLTPRAVRALAGMQPAPQRVMVVAGSLYAGLPELEALLSKFTQLNAELHVSTQQMPALMAGADLAITSGGSTAWELACAGVPNVIASSSERERLTGALLDREGLACYVGHHDEVDSLRMRRSLERLIADPQRLRELALAGRRLVDGRGADRVVDAMLPLLCARDEGSGSGI